MSSIESVSNALYDINISKNKLAAARDAAIEWEILVREWQEYATDESMDRFASAAFQMCIDCMYNIFVSKDYGEPFESVYAAIKVFDIVAQLWQAMTAEDE
jgi:hypothetical protein